MHSTSLTLINNTANTSSLKTSTTQLAQKNTVHRAYSDNSGNQSYIQYTLFNERRLHSKRWLANVSGNRQIKQTDMQAINVQPTANRDDFQIIHSLLVAKTCHTILFDKQFSVAQTKALKELARFSGTRLEFINDKNDYHDYFERRFAH